MHSESLSITSLHAADLPASVELSTRAGWNQLEADWSRLLELWPPLCLAGRAEGDLVATATVARYGTTGWVGMILVDERRRGRGIGGAMFDAALEAATAAGISTTALDATDLGRPVYLKRDFVDGPVVARWLRPKAETRGAIGKDVSPLVPADWPSLLDLDQRSCGIDRSALLRHLATERHPRVLVARDGHRLEGFAFARPGRTAAHIGPVVASDLAVGRRLLESCCARAPDAVLIDTFDRAGWRDVLAELGFKFSRRLTRMSRGSPPGELLCGPQIFATAGLELG